MQKLCKKNMIHAKMPQQSSNNNAAIMKTTSNNLHKKDSKNKQQPSNCHANTKQQHAKNKQ